MEKFTRLTGVAIVILILTVGTGMPNIGYFIDYPSLQFVVGGTFGLLLVTFGKSLHVLFRVVLEPTEYASEEETVLQAVHMVNSAMKYFLITGLVGTCIGAVLLLHNYENSTDLGANIIITLMTIFYAIVINGFILLPIRQYLYSFIPSMKRTNQ